MIVFVLQECFSIITTSKILAKILKHFVLWGFFKYFKADIAWTKYWKSIHFIKKERKSRLTEILYTVILYGNTAKSCPFLKTYQHLEKYYTGNLFRNIHYTMMWFNCYPGVKQCK